MNHKQSPKGEFNRQGLAAGLASYFTVYSTTTSLSAAIFSLGVYMSGQAASNWWLAAAVASTVAVAGGVRNIYQHHCDEVKNWKNPLTGEPSRFSK